MPRLSPQERQQLKDYLATQAGQADPDAAKIQRALAADVDPSALRAASSNTGTTQDGDGRGFMSMLGAGPMEAFGGMVGALGGPLGAAAGGAIGNRADAAGPPPAAGLLNAMSGLDDPSMYGVNTQNDVVGDPGTNKGQPLNNGSPLAGAIRQGTMAGIPAIAGKLAVKVGGPVMSRIGAYLQGKTPNQAVTDSLPAAAQNVPSGSLADMGAASTPAAARSVGQADLAQTARNMDAVTKAQTAKQVLAANQPQMAANASKFPKLSGQLDDAVQGAIGGAPQDMSPAGIAKQMAASKDPNGFLQQLQSGKFGAPQVDRTAAFRDPTQFPQTARDPAVGAARAQLSDLGSQQAALGNSVTDARQAVAATNGLPSRATLADQATGLQSLVGKVPSGAAPQSSAGDALSLMLSGPVGKARAAGNLLTRSGPTGGLGDTRLTDAIQALQGRMSQNPAYKLGAGLPQQAQGMSLQDFLQRMQDNQ